MSLTPSERYLKELCDRSFLSLWSYVGIYRDQKKCGKGDGKELCDLLVVFEDQILIFSDKFYKYPNTGNSDLDWSRWYKHAVQNSAKQIWGAERWIRSHPDRIFLDRHCTIPFPLEIPNLDKAVFHRIIIAHDVSKECRKELGGSGSLMIDSTLIGDMHYVSTKDGRIPYTVGQVDPTRGYIHVFDDTSLNVALRTLDTITDFVTYISRKEVFLSNEKQVVFAAGEDDLLGYYMLQSNKNGEHYFLNPDDEKMDAVSIDEGFWNKFIQSPQRKAQVEADKISYSWDDLIETFNSHILGSTQYHANPPGIANQERVIRFLDREPRLRRRFLSGLILGLISENITSDRAVRIVSPSRLNDPYYVFLLLKRPIDKSYDEYRELREKMLKIYCMVVKYKFPDAKDIVGIATETGYDATRSEDAIYLDARDWSTELQSEAERLQKELGILTHVIKHHDNVYEFPIHIQRKRHLKKKKV